MKKERNDITVGQMRYGTLSLALFMLMLTIFFVNNAFADTATKTVSATIQNSNGTTPADGDITFVAYIEGRETDTQTESDPGFPNSGYASGTLLFNLGNFQNPYLPGTDTMVIEIINSANNEIKTFTSVIPTDPGAVDLGTITLEMPNLLSIAIIPVDQDVTVPGTLQFTAVGIFEGVANPVDITNSVTWDSSDVDKGTIPAGLFTSNHVGTTIITAEQSGVTSNTSTVTVLVGPANTIAYVSGDAQTKTVGTALDNPFVVKVTDAKGNPVSATAATFAVTAGGGTLSVENATTGTDGTAPSTLTLGTTTGANTVTATSGGLTGSPVTFNATGTAGAVSAGQSTVGATTPVVADGVATSTITITAKDQYDNLLQGKAVTLFSTGSNNTLSAAANTDASGETTATLASTKAETKTISATIDGVAITDTADVVFNAGPAQKVGLSATKITLAGNQKGSAILTARLLDQFDNQVATEGVTINLIISANTYVVLDNTSPATNAQGQAVATITTKPVDIVSPPQTTSVHAQSAGLTDSAPVEFTLVNFSINVDAPAAPFYDAATGVHLVTSGSTPSTAKFSGVGSATGNYRWELSSVGTIDSTTADTINYTAPETITGDTQKDTLTLTSAAAGEETLEDPIDINIYNPLVITWPASAVGIASDDTTSGYGVTVSGGTDTYKFQSTPGGVATVNENTGAITPAAVGTCNVQVRDVTYGDFAIENGFFAESLVIEVINPIVIVDKPLNDAMDSGAEKTFSATGGKTAGDVDWEASAGTIGADGKFTAPTVTEGKQEVIITAYDKTYNKSHYTPVKTEYRVTVYAPVGITEKPAGYVDGTPSTYPLLNLGETTTLTAADNTRTYDWIVTDWEDAQVGATVTATTFDVVPDALFDANGAGIYTVTLADHDNPGLTATTMNVRVPMKFVADKFAGPDPEDAGTYNDNQGTDIYIITGGPAAVDVYTYSALDLDGVEVTVENCGTFADDSPTDADNVFTFRNGIDAMASFRVKVALDKDKYDTDADVKRLIDAGLDTLWSGIFRVVPIVDYSGKVVDDADGGPVDGVTVTCTSDTTKTATTNASGDFTITGFSESGVTYKFFVRKDRYIDKIVTGEDIKAGDIVLEQLPAGSGTIAGTITLAGGGPQTEISIKIKADGAYIKDGAGNDITVFTDAVANDGTYSFPVPVDNVDAASYTVEARKSGFIFDDAAGLGVLTFDGPLAGGPPPVAEDKDIELKPVTKITVFGTRQDSTDLVAGTNYDQVLVQITAEAGTPPYEFNGAGTEIVVEGSDGLPITLDEFESVGVDTKTWSFTHNAYENFTITVYADVGEDRDVDSNYKATLVWNYVKSATEPDTTLGVDPISGGTARSPSGDTFVTLPPGGLIGDIIKSVTFVIVEANARDAGATGITGSEIIRDVKVINDATGEEVSNFERFEIRMKFDPTVVTEGTLGSTYMILQANTLEDLVAGNVTEVPASQIIQPVDYVNGYVTFWVDHLSAFGIGGSRGAGGVDDNCFIATAAYGSLFESHVKILRDFRDVYLMPSRIGHAFVDAYYRYSPPIASFIAGHDTLRAVVRVGLMPVVGISYAALHTTAAQKALITFLMFSLLAGAYMTVRRFKIRRTA